MWLRQHSSVVATFGVLCSPRTLLRAIALLADITQYYRLIASISLQCKWDQASADCSDSFLIFYSLKNSYLEVFCHQFVWLLLARIWFRFHPFETWTTCNCFMNATKNMFMYFSRFNLSFVWFMWGHRILCTPATQVTQFRSVSTLLHTKMGKPAFPSAFLHLEVAKGNSESWSQGSSSHEKIQCEYRTYVSCVNIKHRIHYIVTCGQHSLVTPTSKYSILSTPTVGAWVLVEYHDVLQNDSQ